MKEFKLIITEKNDIVYYGYFADGKPLELYCEPKKQQSLMGNIYAARVERTAEGIGGAFLEIGAGEKCYFSHSDTRRPVKLSPGTEGRLRGGDIILVQVTKDAVKTKLPVADSNVGITGKYFVLTLGDKRTGVSRKITGEERDRLLKIAEPFCSEKYGIIVRTNARGVSREALENELRLLCMRYREIMRKAAIAPGKTLLYREPPHYISFGKDLPSDQLDEIWTDSPDIYEELKNFCQENGDEGSMGKLRLYTDDYPLGKLCRLDHFYEQALNRRVWLKSGGSLVIEPTEAMTVIDVNTGSVIKNKKQAEKIFFRMNREAAAEIARQIRLRNLSGIILIDFINMRQSGEQDELMSFFKKECNKDRIRTHVIDMTALNLVEMTRNKVRKPLHEQWRLCHN